MKTFGTLFKQLRIPLVITVLVVSLLIPAQSTTAQGTLIQDDEFDGSSLDTSIWTVTHTEGGASIAVSGGTLQITAPADGSSYTFSNTNERAPRVLQEISDSDFTVEVKFNSSMNVYQDDKIQGILVRDAGADQWLRFDFNTDSDSLNTYMGYVDPSGELKHIENVSVISTSHPAVPLYMRVQYSQSSNQWMVSYRIGDTGDFVMKKTFAEASALGAAGGITFAPTHIGLFAGSTGTLNPGHTLIAEYFINADPSAPPPALVLDNTIYLPNLSR